MGRWIDGRMAECIDGWADGWIDWQMDGQMRMHNAPFYIIIIKYFSSMADHEAS